MDAHKVQSWYHRAGSQDRKSGRKPPAKIAVPKPARSISEGPKPTKGRAFRYIRSAPLSDNGINQRPAETEAARLRQHVQTLHLATPLRLYGSKANAPYRLSVPIAREK